jgi:hypothetical protein
MEELCSTISEPLSVESAIPEWNLWGMVVTMGCAIEANMNGRGIRMAVKTSGRASRGARGSTGAGVSSIGENPDLPPALDLRVGGRPRSDSPRRLPIAEDLESKELSTGVE